MLLSMYASYLWANRNKTTYVLRMVIFVLLASFFSAYFHGSEEYYQISLFLMFFWVPSFYASFLSFPFFAIMDKIYTYPYLAEWLNSYSIRFLTTDLTFAEWESYSLVYNRWEQVLSTFYFFLFVNFLGALLGYLIAKKYRIQFLNEKQGIIFCISMAIASMIGVVFLGSIERVGVTLFGVAILSLDIILFKKLVLPITRIFVQTLRELPQTMSVPKRFMKRWKKMWPG